MMAILLLLAIGLFLSAFFSGSETGFYRATRTKLALDTLDGDRIASGLLWLTNNPALFVATTLVGNNLANYMTSYAIVLGTAYCLGVHTNGVDLAVSILMSPMIFIYGELMPKNLFFHSPNQLLRLSGPLFLFFAILFAPLAAILWALGRVLEYLLGQSPTRTQLQLVRRELKRVLSEGHEAGVLLPTQRQMAEGMFEISTMSLDRFCVSTSRMAVVRESMSTMEMLRIARRFRSPVLFVQDQRRELKGFYHVVDLHLVEDQPKPRLRTIERISRRTSSIAALNKMHTEDLPFAAVTGDAGQIVGIVDARDLGERLLLTGASV